MVDWNSHNCHWEFIEPSGDQLIPRGRHCIATVGRRLFILGGNPESDEEVADVWCLSIIGQSHSWRKIACMGDVPLQRTCASTVSFDNNLWLFGGTNKNTWECSRDLYKLRVFDNLWTLVSPIGDSISARNSHTMVLHPSSSTMYVFGGWDNHRTFFNDLFALHCHGTRWSQISPRRSDKPSPRMGHACVVYRNSIMVIGGFDESQQLCNDVWEFNLASMSWREHHPAGTKLSHRYRHTAVVSNDFIFVMGGTGNDKQRFNDVFVYDISQETWYEFAFPDSTPSPRSFHQSVLIDGAMYVVGGMFGSMKLNDVYRLVTPNICPSQVQPIILEERHVERAKPLPPLDLESMQKKISYYENKIVCKVCFENEINCVLLPCSHRAICMACASEIVNRDNPSCPICRVTITRIFPTIDA